MAPELLLVGVLFATLVLYAITGGADFGGGFWDLFARGPRSRQQRELIAHAIGPIWEANHVWLIIVIVVLFVCFPVAYAAVSTALHIPLSLMLFGIVLRGSAFVFRKYDSQRDAVHRRWSLVFSASSIATPIMFGVCVGAMASGDITMVDGHVTSDFVTPWLHPFPFAVGVLTLVQFAFLAAVYLAVEADTPELQEDFRKRAMVAAVGVGVLAWIVFLFARHEAPVIWSNLAMAPWSGPFQAITAVAAVGAIQALRRRWLQRARVLAVAQVTLVTLGWAVAQYPWILVDALTIEQAKGPDTVLWTTLVILGVGAIALVPTYLWMMRVFKGATLDLQRGAAQQRKPVE